MVRYAVGGTLGRMFVVQRRCVLICGSLVLRETLVGVLSRVREAYYRRVSARIAGCASV